MATTISASQFKARCLALLDEVGESGGELIVTKRGRPIAKLVAVDADVSLRGSVTYNVGDEELIAPLEIEWDAETPHA